MDRLRPRDRQVFLGFTKAEIEKLEKLLKESGDKLVNREFCRKTALNFNRSSGRAGKPVVKWTEVHDWFQSRQQDLQKANGSAFELPEAHPSDKTHLSPQDLEAREKIPDVSKLEFEARSSKDGAWYDVDMFLTHRILSTGEAFNLLSGKLEVLCDQELQEPRNSQAQALSQSCVEFGGSEAIDQPFSSPLSGAITRGSAPREVRVRFVGFGAEEDEWVNVKKAVRERSLPLEHSECDKLKVGDLVLCFQERRDQAIYYDAHIIEIQRRMHDIRGCRCLFLIRYDHDNTEERVRLRRLCRRPSY